jgi:hypothetical protein
MIVEFICVFRFNAEVDLCFGRLSGVGVGYVPILRTDLVSLFALFLKLWQFCWLILHVVNNPGRAFFFRFPKLFAIWIDTFKYVRTISKWCVGKRWRVEECSVAPLRDKRVKTLCGCREKRVQTKEKYKLRLTTKTYKLSYNYINYTINLGHAVQTDSRWGEFLNSPNLSDRTRPWGLLSL